MEDHPHTHPIHIPMGIPIPTAALGTTPRSGPHMFMPIIMWEMCRACSAVLHQVAYIDVMRVLLVQLSAPMHTAAARPAVPSVNSRPSLVSCCSLHLLEHST